jgi:2C-methyl-D-erythritol 2,4-cyclodiphosphate synthase
VLELEQVLHKFEDGKQKIERYLRAQVQAKKSKQNKINKILYKFEDGKPKVEKYLRALVQILKTTLYIASIW